MRLTAINTLGELELDETMLPRIIPAIVSRLSDPDEEVAQAAVFVLGELREYMLPYTELVAEFLHHPHSDVRCNALDTLGGLGDNASQEAGRVAERLTDADTAVRFFSNSSTFTVAIGIYSSWHHTMKLAPLPFAGSLIGSHIAWTA